MSVKLPLIIKRQMKPSPRRSSHSEEEVPLKKRQPSEEKYEEDQFEQDVVEEAPEPVETITVLKKEHSVGRLQSELINIGESDPTVQEGDPSPPNNPVHKDELQKLLEEKMQQAAALKETVAERKKDIKSIGEQIDKDLNKSLLRTTKQSTVSIRDIFSAPPKTNNKRINDLNDQLKAIRITIKKVKTDIQKITESLTDPVIVINQEKGIDFEARIRSADEDIRLVEKEKEMLTEEIARGNKQYNEQQEKQRADQYSKLSTTLAEILTAQKECKASIYQVDREDILHMEKIKFFQEREGGLGQPKKSKPSEKEKIRIDEEIRQLILDINDIIEERNRIESEKKMNLKNLTNEIASMQAKNWDLCNKLREIDSFLLQYYQKKSKKKQIKNVTDRVDKQPEPFQKSPSGRIQPQFTHLDTPTRTIQYQNDKNKRSVSDIVLVQKKKNYDFTNKETDDSDIYISDEFLGGKLNIFKLIITAGQDKIFSIKAIYELNFKLAEGYVLGSKRVPEGAERIEIELNREFQEIINFMHVGYSQNQFICYLQLVTTQGKEYKWGNAERSVKSDQKHIKKYEFCFLKARMTPCESISGEDDQFCLSGLMLSTIYLSAK